MQFHDEASTKRLIEFGRLVPVLKDVLAEYARGKVTSPERLVVPCGDGAGLLLSMPCQAADLVIHKLLTIYAGNPTRGLPAIQGQVTVFDARSGAPLFCLDGPGVTARRTAAMTLIGIERLHPRPPATITVIGTGAQARGHVEAILGTLPNVALTVRGTSRSGEQAFCRAFQGAGDVTPQPAGPIESEVVIAVTSSRSPVYDQPPEVGRLVIGVGAYRLDMIEIGSRTISGSQVYVDDPVGAPGEAGDVAAAGIDWSNVRPLADAIEARPDFERPIFLKSVGCGAWDLAACRVARAALEATDA